MYLIGYFTIYFALIIAIYSLFITVSGIYLKKNKFINSGKNGSLATFFLSSISIGLLLYLLGTNQFQFEYVAQHTNKDLSLIFKLTSLWAGSEGSLLLWAFLLTLFNIIILFSRKLKDNPLIPYVNSVMLVNIIFFYIILTFFANPFKLLPYTLDEGHGLNPMLWDFGMIVHPVTIYLGYVSLAIPFAFAIASLIVKDNKIFWLKIVRKWALFSWVFLTLGNLIGARWAYTELGWGGYWAWDPVENTSLLPWLTLTAFLHSIMIQERKNTFKMWNYILIFFSYSLTIFGTYLVRSGIVTSVHAFAGSDYGNLFLLLLILMLSLFLFLLIKNYQLISKNSYEINSLLTREFTFLLNNILLTIAAFVVIMGTLFPLTSNLIKGTKLYLDSTYYNTVMAPIMLSILLLMSIGVLITWKKSSTKIITKKLKIASIISICVTLFLFISGVTEILSLISTFIISLLITTHLYEFYYDTNKRRYNTKENFFVALKYIFSNNRQRYGGYIVHIGIGLIAIGIIGSQIYDVSTVRTININQTIQIEEYTLKYDNLTQEKTEGKDIISANISVYKSDEHITDIKTEKRFHQNWYEPSTKIGLYSTLKEDLYIVINSWENNGKATFTIKINPLVSWIWIGGIISVLGAIVAFTDKRYELK